MLKPTGSSSHHPIRFTTTHRPQTSSPQIPTESHELSAQDSVQFGSPISETTALAAAPERPTFIEGEVMVKTKGSLFKTDQQSLLESLGASVKERFEFPSSIFKSFEGEVLRLQLPDGLSTKEALAKLADDPRVEYAVPNELTYLDEVESSPVDGSGQELDAPPNGRKPDDLDSKLWGLHNRGQNGGTEDADIDAPEAWATTTGSENVLIAVIDTGVDYNHPDLKANMWTNPGEIPGDGIDNDGNGVIDDVHGYNAFADTGNPMDAHSHGTHCAGTIAAKGNNGLGITGVAWDAKIMAVKIFDDSGRTSSDAILRGILYASKNGARITSNSWGGGGANQLIKDAFESSPAFHVMAAGNDGRNVDRNANYPSGYDIPNSIAVAATDRNDRLAGFSNYGAKEVDLGAPGVDTYSTIPNGRYGNKSGTSMATPHVSGAAALLVAAEPGISNEELKSRLMSGADRISSLRGKTVSGGRLNIANSLENDKVAPGEIRELHGKAVDPKTIDLRFLATGDDGFEGRASAYEVRVSDEPIQTLEEFLQGASLGEIKPSEAGVQESLRVSVTPSTEAREMHVAIRALDNGNNASSIARQTILVPAADLAFSEPVEQDTQGWTAEGTWGLEKVGNRVVFSDSPGTLSPNQANQSITSPVIDLSKFSGSSLMFDTEFKLEQELDQVRLEAARPVADGQEQEWKELASYTGTDVRPKELVDLSSFDGGPVQVRFRLTTDHSYTEDGFQFDNLMVLGQDGSK